MKTVKPHIFHLASTSIDSGGLDAFLRFHGVSDWKTDAYSNGEALIEIAGRRCYKSFETETVSVSEMNPNLSKVRDGNKSYIGNILRVGHGSVLEHSSVTFAFENVSRVFTHEVVRHRLCAFSQESLRFVRPTSLDAYFPDVFEDLPDTLLTQPQINNLFSLLDTHVTPSTIKGAVEAVFKSTIINLEDVQKYLVEILGMNDTSRLFGDKKKLQSAMRRLMPIGLATGIIVTTNHRNWRHLIALRTAKGAEEEIRLAFSRVAEDLLWRYPAIYQDMKKNENEEFVFDFGRV